MNNLYNSLNINTCERIVTLENYTYGTKVKCSIPTLMPFVKKEEIHIRSNMINNKKQNGISINKINTENYVLIKIPEYLYEGSYHSPKTGNKGDVFIGMCVSGDINKLNIISKE